MPEKEILSELQAIAHKVDRLLSIVETLQADNRLKSSARKSKPKAPPATLEEIGQHQATFEQIYDRWLSGHELEVQEQLDKLDADELRRFADSNNLNVTAKMSKERVLQLIGSRFREKKQLLGASATRSDLL